MNKLLVKEAKLNPPPLTGGGQGVGEVATCRFHIYFPLFLTLPRQGGGNFWFFLQETLMKTIWPDSRPIL